MLIVLIDSRTVYSRIAFPYWCGLCQQLADLLSKSIVFPSLGNGVHHFQRTQPKHRVEQLVLKVLGAFHLAQSIAIEIGRDLVAIAPDHGWPDFF